MIITTAYGWEVWPYIILRYCSAVSRYTTKRFVFSVMQYKVILVCFSLFFFLIKGFRKIWNIIRIIWWITIKLDGVTVNREMFILFHAKDKNHVFWLKALVWILQQNCKYNYYKTLNIILNNNQWCGLIDKVGERQYNNKYNSLVSSENGMTILSCSL